MEYSLYAQILIWGMAMEINRPDLNVDTPEVRKRFTDADPWLDTSRRKEWTRYQDSLTYNGFRLRPTTSGQQKIGPDRLDNYFKQFNQLVEELNGGQKVADVQITPGDARKSFISLRDSLYNGDLRQIIFNSKNSDLLRITRSLSSIEVDGRKMFRDILMPKYVEKDTGSGNFKIQAPNDGSDESRVFKGDMFINLGAFLQLFSPRKVELWFLVEKYSKNADSAHEEGLKPIDELIPQEIEELAPVDNATQVAKAQLAEPESPLIDGFVIEVPPEKPKEVAPPPKPELKPSLEDATPVEETFKAYSVGDRGELVRDPMFEAFFVIYQTARENVISERSQAQSYQAYLKGKSKEECEEFLKLYTKTSEVAIDTTHNYPCFRSDSFIGRRKAVMEYIDSFKPEEFVDKSLIPDMLTAYLCEKHKVDPKESQKMDLSYITTSLELSRAKTKYIESYNTEVRYRSFEEGIVEKAAKQVADNARAKLEEAQARLGSTKTLHAKLSGLNEALGLELAKLEQSDLQAAVDSINRGMDKRWVGENDSDLAERRKMFGLELEALENSLAEVESLINEAGTLLDRKASGEAKQDMQALAKDLLGLDKWRLDADILVKQDAFWADAVREEEAAKEGIGWPLTREETFAELAVEARSDFNDWMKKLVNMFVSQVDTGVAQNERFHRFKEIDKESGGELTANIKANVDKLSADDREAMSKQDLRDAALELIEDACIKGGLQHYAFNESFAIPGQSRAVQVQKSDLADPKTREQIFIDFDKFKEEVLNVVV